MLHITCCYVLLSCSGEAIPACAPNRCTTRFVSWRNVFVCLRCQAGHQPSIGADGSPIIQCGEPHVVFISITKLTSCIFNPAGTA
jgi:hypothetical protein